MGRAEPQDLMVNSTEIAKLIGRTSRTVQQLTTDGILPTIEVKNGKRATRRYDKYKTVQAYIEHVSKKAEEKGGSKEDEKLQIEIETKKAKLRITQLELEEIEGRMHKAEDVENMTTDLVLCVRSNLLSMPGQLAVDLAGMNDASEISARIQKDVYDILDDLSSYKYNPEEYRKRVRERQGWIAREQGEEDDG